MLIQGLTAYVLILLPNVFRTQHERIPSLSFTRSFRVNFCSLENGAHNAVVLGVKVYDEPWPNVLNCIQLFNNLKEFLREDM